MPKKKVATVNSRTDEDAKGYDALSDYVTCGNCGQGIAKAQPYTVIKNLRFKGHEYYHESYMGCYESTQRRNSRPRRILNRFHVGINEIFEADYISNLESNDVSEVIITE